METAIYNQEGKKAGSVKLSERVFGLNWNADLVHQVIVSMLSNKRTHVAHTKDRSEVSGTGRKPWQQKGTGRARHGSRRSPIWRTGGVAHGPRNDRNFTKSINKKVRAKALYVALSKKYKDGEILFVDNIGIETPKTKSAKGILESLSKIKGFEGLATKKKNAAFISLGRKDLNVLKSFNNFGNIEVGETRNLNPMDILNYKYLIIENPDDSVEFIESRLGVNRKKKGAAQTPSRDSVQRRALPSGKTVTKKTTVKKAVVKTKTVNKKLSTTN